jgi:hypothetical protein
VAAIKPVVFDIALAFWPSPTGGFAMRRAVFYLRVSTIDQTTANQERELRDVAARMGCEVVKVYKDHGISGAKGRDKRDAVGKLPSSLKGDGWLRNGGGPDRL